MVRLPQSNLRDKNSEITGGLCPVGYRKSSWPVVKVMLASYELAGLYMTHASAL